MVIPYYLLKERCQEIGFEGENLENQKRGKIITNSKTIKAEHVKQKFPDIGDNSRLCYVFFIDSISQPGHWYEVDLRAYTCTCLDYPAICFCKHIHAVQTHFPSLQPLENLPQAAVKSDSLSTASRPTGLALLSGMSKFVYLIKNSRLIFSKKLTAKALVPYLLLYRVRTTIQVYYKMFPRSLSTLQLNSDCTEPLSKPCGLACGLTRNLGIQ